MFSSPFPTESLTDQAEELKNEISDKDKLIKRLAEKARSLNQEVYDKTAHRGFNEKQLDHINRYENEQCRWGLLIYIRCLSCILKKTLIHGLDPWTLFPLPPDHAQDYLEQTSPFVNRVDEILRSELSQCPETLSQFTGNLMWDSEKIDTFILLSCSPSTAHQQEILLEWGQLIRNKIREKLKEKAQMLNRMIYKKETDGSTEETRRELIDNIKDPTPVGIQIKELVSLCESFTLQEKVAKKVVKPKLSSRDLSWLAEARETVRKMKMQEQPVKDASQVGVRRLFSPS